MRWIALASVVGLLAAPTVWAGTAIFVDNSRITELSSNPQTITFTTPVKFMDTFYDQMSVSRNGVVNFGTSTGAVDVAVNFQFSTCTAAHGPYIAVAWTQAAGSGGAVEFTEVTEADIPDADFLVDDTNMFTQSYRMIKYFENSLSVKYGSTKYAFLLTWRSIPGDVSPETSTFQLFLMTDGCQTYIGLNYVVINYLGVQGSMETTPIAAISGGLDANDGDYTCLVMPDSGSRDFVNLETAPSNAHDTLGKSEGWFVFRVDSSVLYTLTLDSPLQPLKICLDSCTANGGTCGTTYCVCGMGATVVDDTVDCTSASTGYTGCWEDPTATSSAPCMYPCYLNANFLCPAPCGGCGTKTATAICDNCSTEPTEVTCNNNKCPRSRAVERFFRPDGKKVRRNRKCCYSYRGATPVLLNRRKSCCRRKVRGFIGGKPICR